ESLASRSEARQRLRRPELVLLVSTGRRIPERVAHSPRVLVSASSRNTFSVGVAWLGRPTRRKFAMVGTRSPAREMSATLRVRARERRQRVSGQALIPGLWLLQPQDRLRGIRRRC